ncbi:MAG: hypothetical protein Q8P39_02985 [Candidatus Yanofskybacteria bacterium]|nr:hypothetical protein [Candidatus Yanofskybacteria bacterium]
MEQLLSQQKKRQRVLTIVLGILVAVIGVVVWAGFFRAPSSLPVSFPVASESELRQVNINFSVFENPIFETLRTPPDPIPLPEQVGRNNPFAPLSP